MNKLELKLVHLEPNPEIIAAQAKYEFCEQELKRSRKAVWEAEEQLELMLANALKSQQLKLLEGEVIHLPEYKATFCYYDGEFNMIPVPEECYGQFPEPD